MSHYTVLVVGENPEDQLAPFREPDGEEEEKELERQYSKVQAKWDWYELGGRWTGYFKLKEGRSGEVGSPGLMTKEAKDGYADSALKKDIDFEAMRKEKAELAARQYDAYLKALDGEKFTPFKQIDADNENIEKAREEYHSQKSVQNCRKAGIWPEEFSGYTRASFIEHAEKNYLETFAILKDGRWSERGSMGWFGCVSDDKEDDAWLQEFDEIFNLIPDDTLLSIYDCHI